VPLDWHHPLFLRVDSLSFHLVQIVPVTSTTHRSGLGLLFLVTGEDDGETKIVVSRFPADSGVLAEEKGKGLTVEFLERIFMKGAKSYKAKEAYTSRCEKVLVPLAARIEDHLKNLFVSLGRIDRISVPAKSVDRFLGKAAKAEDGKPKYEDPLNQIQGQVGARIVTFYASDVERVRLEIEKYFEYIESQRIVPESEKEFGYEGGTVRITDKNSLPARVVGIHDLGYKPSVQLTSDQKRRFAFTAAQAWGADQIFDEMLR
jgi:putative GTP pyrophosphokinase